MSIRDSPSEELERLLEFCEGLGYGERRRAVEFPVWTGESVLRPDITCFADEQRHDMATAVVVAGLVSGDQHRMLHWDAAGALGAPLSVLVGADGLEFWALTGSKRHSPVERLSLTPTDPNLIRFFGPQALLRAKTRGTQLPLFDIQVDLLAKAREWLGGSLSTRVQAAVLELLPSNDEEISVEAAEHAVQLTVQALTLLAVRDKMVPERRFTDALAYAQEHFPDHLSLTSVDYEALTDTADRIGKGIDFASLDAAVLGDVYERAILEPARRSELGAYYTPPSLGRRILANIPVEELAPGDRKTFDPACGSGTLLLAANARLQSAADDAETDRARYETARNLLVGADRDTFAVGIARLALLLGALPYGNGYNIFQEDALSAAPTTRANVVVANPPWRWTRGDGARQQVASQFLRALSDRCNPGGFLACVLPATWLTDQTSRESREWVRANHDVAEIWRLPERVFPEAEVAPCVVFAQKHPERVSRPNAYVFRHVTPPKLDSFLQTGTVGQTLIGSEQTGDQPFTVDPLAGITAFEAAPRLRDVAAVRNGIPVVRMSQVARPNGNERLLPGYGSVPAFGEVQPSGLIPVAYPQGFWTNQTSAASTITVPKVLVSATRRVDNPWRLKAIVDEIGVIPRNSMHIVVPSPNTRDTRLALLGVLGCSVASLWVDARSSSRNVREDTVASIPVPPPHTWPDIARAAKFVVNAHPTDRARILMDLEHTVWDAYGLTSDDVTLVSSLLAGFTAPEGQTRFVSSASPDRFATGHSRNVGGVVDVFGDRVKLVVPGVTSREGEWIRVPERFPGFALYPGATLDVYGVEDGLAEASYELQERSWESMDDVLTELRML